MRDAGAPPAAGAAPAALAAPRPRAVLAARLGALRDRRGGRRRRLPARPGAHAERRRRPLHRLAAHRRRRAVRRPGPARARPRELPRARRPAARAEHERADLAPLLLRRLRDAAGRPRERPAPRALPRDPRRPARRRPRRGGADPGRVGRPSGVAAGLCLALAFTTLPRIVWQFLFHLRTDVYYLITTVLGLDDLDAAARQRLRELVRRPAATPRALGERDRRAARWYAPLMVAGYALSVAMLVLVVVPLAAHFFGPALRLAVRRARGLADARLGRPAEHHPVRALRSPSRSRSASGGPSRQSAGSFA